jgi:fructan beta-fructosidase
VDVNCNLSKDMKTKRISGLILVLLSLGLQRTPVTAQEKPSEKHRPQIHFTPKVHWMNDPNGMVYYKGIYHLFYQYYPGGTQWGPMHWAHASSKDLMHWEHLPVALFPDSLGLIFSGSVVVDYHNTSGLGKGGKVPMVAIFTQSSTDQSKQKQKISQYQSLAFSLDDGLTWKKYAGNPVLPNPGIADFRDPKVHWNETIKKWIMTLATKDRITFYSSPNLKDWKKESEFGEKLGAHGGVWECPDLFPLKINGKTKWVLLISINPGGPNGGSATQYFIGDFNGHEFIPASTETRWLDYGTDNYAGITWSNTGKRKIFIGWMNNWQYAGEVPTEAWRGATTVPRALKLVDNDKLLALSSFPVKELQKLENKASKTKHIKVDSLRKLTTKPLSNAFKLELSGKKLRSFELILSNDLGEKLIAGFDEKSNRYFVDRTNSGEVSFNKEFPKVHYAPRIGEAKALDMTLVVDVASLELFAEKGQTVMTDVFFPNKPFSKVSIRAGVSFDIDEVKITELKSIL